MCQCLWVPIKSLSNSKVFQISVNLYRTNSFHHSKCHKNTYHQDLSSNLFTNKMFITYNTRTLMHVIAGTRANILKMHFILGFILYAYY